MPIYAYTCTTCKQARDVLQKIGAPAPAWWLPAERWRLLQGWLQQVADFNVETQQLISTLKLERVYNNTL